MIYNSRIKEIKRLIENGDKVLLFQEEDLTIRFLGGKKTLIYKYFGDSGDVLGSQACTLEDDTENIKLILNAKK